MDGKTRVPRTLRNRILDKYLLKVNGKYAYADLGYRLVCAEVKLGNYSRVAPRFAAHEGRVSNALAAVSFVGVAA